jgi:hypothetical protein
MSERRRKRQPPWSFANPSNDLRFRFELAELLHKTVAEIEEMNSREFHYWKIWSQIKEQEHERSQR